MSEDSPTGLKGGDFVYISLEVQNNVFSFDSQSELAPGSMSTDISYTHPFRDTYALLLGRGSSPQLEEELYGASVGHKGLIELTWTEDGDGTDRSEVEHTNQPPYIRAPARTVDDMLPEWLATIARKEGASTPHEFVNLPTTEIADGNMLDPDRLEEFQSNLADEIDGWILAEYEVVDSYRWSGGEVSAPSRSTGQSADGGYSDIRTVNSNRAGDPSVTAAHWWPMAGGNRLLTGTTATTIPTELPDIAWQTRVPGGVTTSPIITGEMILVGDDEGWVSAFNPAGDRIWSHELDGAISAAPVYTDGTAFLGSESGEVVGVDIRAVDTSDNDVTLYETKWERRLGEPIDHVVPCDGILLARTKDGTLHALDLKDGTTEWSGDTSSNHGANILVWENLAVTRFSNTLRVADLRTGSISLLSGVGVGDWDSPTGAISDGRIVTGSHDGIVCRSINQTDTGAFEFSDTIWHVAVGGKVRVTPAISDQLVSVTTDRSRVYGFDLTDGEKLWSDNLRDDLRSSPVTDGDTILVSSANNALFALNADDGSVHWNISTAGAVTAPPAVADGMVLVADEEGQVTALR